MVLIVGYWCFRYECCYRSASEACTRWSGGWWCIVSSCSNWRYAKSQNSGAQHNGSHPPHHRQKLQLNPQPVLLHSTRYVHLNIQKLAEHSVSSCVLRQRCSHPFSCTRFESRLKGDKRFSLAFNNPGNATIVKAQDEPLTGAAVSLAVHILEICSTHGENLLAVESVAADDVGQAICAYLTMHLEFS